MKKYCFHLILISAGLFWGCVGASAQPASDKNPKRSNWISLFDGRTFSGWRLLSGKGWKIENNELIAIPFSEKKQSDIITDSEFENFELVFDFRIFNMTNSGVKYLVTNSFEKQKGSFLGLEYQILDDKNYKYTERGGFRTTASL